MSAIRFDSKFEKATDVVWSTTRTLAYSDIAFRGLQHFLQNNPSAPPFCQGNSVANPCAPQRQPVLDIYAGMTMYMGAVLAVGCLGHTLHNMLRDPNDLKTRWQASQAIKVQRGVYELPRDKLGWTANSYIAAIMCGLHGVAGYNLNKSVSDSHGFRLVTGCLVGAGVILGIVSKIAFVTQLLPQHMSAGRAVPRAISPLMSGIADFKTMAILHVGISLLYSSVAAASAHDVNDPWAYRYWAAPLLGLAAVVDLATAATLSIASARMAPKQTVSNPSGSQARESLNGQRCTVIEELPV